MIELHELAWAESQPAERRVCRACCFTVLSRYTAESICGACHVRDMLAGEAAATYRHKDEPRRVKRGQKRPQPLRTHCFRGHELTPDNTAINKTDGHRRCRTCQNVRAEARRERRRRKGMAA